MKDTAQQIIETKEPTTVRLSPETETLLTDIAKSRLDEEKKRNKKSMRPGDWLKLRGPLPNKVAPGYAIISDMDGNGAQMIECSMIMVGSADSECMPIEGRMRGRTLFGSLVDKILARELMVLQFSKYPELRDDNEYHIRSTKGGKGFAVYPNDGKAAGQYVEFEGTFYAKNHVVAQEMLAKAKAEAAPRRLAEAKAAVAQLEKEGAK